MTICLIGFMGCGKSSVGRALSAIMGLRFIDLDEYVQTHEGLTITQLFACGEEYFRKAESRCLEEILAKADEDTVLALGGGTLINGQNLRLVLENTRSVYLKASLPVIRKRIEASDTDRPLYDANSVERLFKSRLQNYAKAEFTVDTDSISPEKAAEIIADLLAGKGAD